MHVMLKSQRTEIDELVGDIEGGLEASPFNSGGDEGCVGRRERSDKRLTTTAFRHKLDVHALAGRVDGHVRPAAAVRADRLAVVGSTVVDADVVERTTATQTV